jgi:hypothetical protein
MKKPAVSLAILLLVMLFQGCSGTKPYPKQSMENITVSTKLDNGSFLRSMNAYLHVYHIDAECTTHYQGTVELDKARVQSGIAVNQETELVFVFANSSFIPEMNSALRAPAYLTAKKGYSYEFDVVYEDDLYNIEAFEVNDQTKKRRKLDFENPTCQS